MTFDRDTLTWFRGTPVFDQPEYGSQPKEQEYV